MKSVDSELTHEERIILKFLLDEYKRKSRFPTIEEVKTALNQHYDEEIENKMLRQFARRGLCGVGLTEEHLKLMNYIVDQDSKFDRVPSFKELKEALNFTSEEVDKGLAQLEKIGVITREKDDPKKFLPRILKRGYDHVVILKDGRREEPACAIDALGIPFMYGQDATILSKDPISTQQIKIEIRNGQIIAQEPKEIIVYFGCDCATILFFSSTANMKRWSDQHPNQSGAVLNMDQALSLARQLFEKRLELDYAPSYCMASDPKRRTITLVKVPSSIKDVCKCKQTCNVDNKL